MSTAIQIAEEEIARIRQDYPEVEGLPNLLDVLEARLKDRLLKETVEVDEGFAKRFEEAYPSLAAQEAIPPCHFQKQAGCPNQAAYEGWSRKKDPFTGETTGQMLRIQVCEDHKLSLIGFQEKDEEFLNTEGENDRQRSLDDDIPF